MLKNYVVQQPKPDPAYKETFLKRPPTTNQESVADRIKQSHANDEKDRRPSPVRKTNWFDSDGEGEK